jgi:hypothetical protein
MKPIYFVFNEEDNHIINIEEFQTLEATKVELKWRNKTLPPNIFPHAIENPQPVLYKNKEEVNK